MQMMLWPRVLACALLLWRVGADAPAPLVPLVGPAGTGCSGLTRAVCSLYNTTCVWAPNGCAERPCAEQPCRTCGTGCAATMVAQSQCMCHAPNEAPACALLPKSLCPAVAGCAVSPDGLCFASTGWYQFAKTREKIKQ